MLTVEPLIFKFPFHKTDATGLSLFEIGSSIFEIQMIHLLVAPNTGCNEQWDNNVLELNRI